ncbi:hypothetical protein [Escherichia coli]|uniref:Protease n=1 Tax=Escherichia phage UB TaxID=2268588 RepID=A0A2Z5H9R9_9CAUD|nr:hypothetical protein [Escherichia coli]AXC36891.1 hypothetical protein [Escherichia phage UB]MED6536373.1 hypothetical protein [Escherichia coli O157]QBO61940.1 hypothetical protein G17_00451 [Escherichia phage vB_EcoM_G17]QDF13969.1 hypothetical protein vBEcoMphAPEC6_gp345c [Escherichia phage vB_EcoM_phAPEC6]WIL00726.1 hypothetical protein [Escherichia phage vB_EcoM_CRJP21]WNN14767.1 hypothetical protein Sharanji_gp486 [Escherichia phage Sharanji]WPK18286.1 hypothetical protein [Salmonel
MTCIIAHTDGVSSFIAGDKLGSNGFTKTVQTEPKVFEKEFIKLHDDGLTRTKEVMALGYTTSFRMGQLLNYNLNLPEQDASQTFSQYLVLKVIPIIRQMFKEEWGARDASQDVGGGQFIILHNHTIYEVQEDFSVLQPKTRITAVGSGTYHAIAAMQAYIEVENESKKPLHERIKSIFKIVSDNVTSVSEEFDVLKY